MTATVRVLIVPAEGPILDKRIPNELDAYQAAVGGWIEGIGDEGWGAYCNEEGKLDGLPVNRRADQLAHQLGWDPYHGDVLVGPVVFFGDYDEEGEVTDVPKHVIELAMTLFGRTTVQLTT